jgi:hypothetical protein
MAAALLLALCARPGPLAAAEPSGGPTFDLQRTVQLPSGASQPAVVVTEFFTQGQLRPDGKNLAVSDNHRLVPWRLLQVGPGDYCRVAFQPVRGQKSYTVSYGGLGAEKSPPWTSPAGLLLETHRWRPCDLNSPQSVREALAAAEPVGRQGKGDRAK